MIYCIFVALIMYLMTRASAPTLHVLTTPCHGNAYRIIATLRGASIGQRWIPLTKGQQCRNLSIYYCKPIQAIKQIIEFPVIWYVIKLAQTKMRAIIYVMMRWRIHMERRSMTGGLPSQMASNVEHCVFIGVSRNKTLKKQPSCGWFRRHGRQNYSTAMAWKLT